MTGPAVVDYSTARPTPASILGSGYSGVIRYLCWQPNPKVVTAAEMQQLWGAGLDVGLVWESTAQAASGGFNVGAGEGVEALRQANALGWPPDRPVYFVMEDPNPVPTSNWPRVEDYCRGLRSAGWPVTRIGGYGSMALIEHLLDLHLITWGWQVGGWSPNVSGICHLYQRLKPTIAAASIASSVDEDAILKPDWGGYRPGATPTQPVAQSAPSSEEPDMIAEIWHDNTNQYIVWANGTKTKIPDPASGSALVANPAFTYRQVPTELLAAIPGG